MLKAFHERSCDCSVTANIRAPVCQLIGYVLICFRWVRRCRGARRCRSTAATKSGHYQLIPALDKTEVEP